METAAPARIRVGFIVGATAAGKSSIALQIAEQLGGEIVNADSRQVYRGMDIGTAKPRAEELRRIPHHLIDIRNPDTPLDVAEFASLARAAIAEIAKRGRPVLVVGGSGLYVRATRSGIFPGPPASPEIRAALYAQASQYGVGYLLDRLADVDPQAVGRIKPNDLKRIVRALEIYQQTGRPISEHQRRHLFAERPFETLTVGLMLSRDDLYATIERRFDLMMKEGLLAEVQMLMAKGYQVPLSTIGYREIARYLASEISLSEAIGWAKRSSRQLAKRQLTWFRADPEIVWLEATKGVGEALKLFRDFFSGEITVPSSPALKAHSNGARTSETGLPSTGSGLRLSEAAGLLGVRK
jgi:tRNA dimethylallyltransferase